MKEKILAYVKDNRLFVSVIALLMVIFASFMDDLWCRQQHGGGDVLYRCDSFVNVFIQTKFAVSFWRRLPSQRLKEVKRISQK